MTTPYPAGTSSKFSPACIDAGCPLLQYAAERAPVRKPRRHPEHPDDLRYGFLYAVAYSVAGDEGQAVTEVQGFFLRLDQHNGTLMLVLDMGEGDEFWVNWKDVYYVERI